MWHLWWSFQFQRHLSITHQTDGVTGAEIRWANRSYSTACSDPETAGRSKSSSWTKRATCWLCCRCSRRRSCRRRRRTTTTTSDPRRGGAAAGRVSAMALAATGRTTTGATWPVGNGAYWCKWQQEPSMIVRFWCTPRSPIIGQCP